jgi:hypothetical protein
MAKRNISTDRNLVTGRRRAVDTTPAKRMTNDAAILNRYVYGGRLPVRMQFLDRKPVIAGTNGAIGDAGWTRLEVLGLESLKQIAQYYPQARMPCWDRLGI